MEARKGAATDCDIVAAMDESSVERGTGTLLLKVARADENSVISEMADEEFVCM